MALIRRFTICLLVMASASAQAQSLVTIDVKPARSADLQSRRVRVFPNGDLVATSVNAITLIDEGYSVPANPSSRLSTLPPWVYSERYDIAAKAAPVAKRSGSSDNGTKMVKVEFRQVLADRFKLKMRVENKWVPVYALLIASGGLKLKRAKLTNCVFDDAPDGCHNFVIGFGHPLNARAIDLDDLAHYIENWTDLPVVNKTAITGLFTVNTPGWRPMRLPPPPNGSGTVDFTQLPSIGAVLRPLGLELRKQEATVPIYTVEHIEPPSTYQPRN
ncbi:MAG TPA: TIGR03435 family protein [Bryobacteraceae bacterium]